MKEILLDTLKKAALDRANIKTDSRMINPGDVFFAIKGTTHDGHNYIHEALKKGARRIFCEREPSGLSGEELKKVTVVESTRIAIGYAAKNAFGDPSHMLTVHGVTGTNGKTTTVFLIDSFLKLQGKSSGLVSTVFTRSTGDSLNRSYLTTPDVITLNNFLSEMAADRKDSAILEISSHALSQERVCGIALDSAVFTNITPEHLDYHKNMEIYLKDKSKIFRNLKANGTAVLNFDDPMVIGLAKVMHFPRLVTFGMDEKADVRAKNLRMVQNKTKFDLIVRRHETVSIETKLIGKHNVYNILAAVSALLNSGLDLSAIKEVLRGFPAVPGRLDAVISNAPFNIFVDYAHTHDALRNVLRTVRFLTPGKLICVFGCGGNRDTFKRPLMGKVAAEVCDEVIITNDNPRMEDPKNILSQIEKGMVNKKNYSIIEQRQDAIHRAIKIAGKGDIILIAGKGHEDYQIIGNKVVAFNDKKVAAGILTKMGYTVMTKPQVR